VVRRIGKKDKNVYRIARRKLKDIAEREALPKRIREQCAALCEKVERLGRYGSWVQDHALLDLLDRQWAEIESEADQEWGARYRRERDRFLAEYEVYRNEHEAQIAEEEARAVNVATRERLIEELAACVSESDEQTLGLRLKDIELRWTGLELLPDKLQGNLERQYGHAHQEAESRLDLIRTRRKTTARLKKMLETAGKMRNQSSPIDRKRLTTLLDGAKPLLATEGIDKSLREHFAEARRELEEKFRRQVRHAEQRLGQAASKLAELKGTVEAGELKRALPLFQSLHACVELAELSGLPRQRVSGLSDELRALGPPLRELQKWRRYGADTHREGLCQAMTELEHADMPLEAKALRLHDLQMEWKALDKSGSPANQSLWDRFHEASGKVYACCKLFLDQQAESREIARAARQALCMQLEDFLDQVDWERIDWKQTLRAEREMRREWSTMGEVEGRYRRALERRFRAALKRLDDRISAERAENQALKRDLIKRVEALADAPNLDWAIEETKRLQRQWRTTVPARQKEENKLWQRFRTACDSVFDRRRQQHEAEEAELVENLKSREAICAEAEALSQSELNPAVLAAEVRSIEARWNDTEALPLPRRSAGALRDNAWTSNALRRWSCWHARQTFAKRWSAPWRLERPARRTSPPRNRLGRPCPPSRMPRSSRVSRRAIRAH
jgi:hypothetical protein